MPTAEAVRPQAAKAESFRASLPLLNLVPELQKRGLASAELTSVAGHELNHALVAIAHGAPIVSLSVIREGNSLGRTILGGIVSLETMKVIAAGGGVDTHDGHAEGYGSDKYKVDILSHYHGGHSWDTARSVASGIVSTYSREVRRRAAEIVAYLGRVSGSDIPSVMLRAQMEINAEKQGDIEPFVQISMPQVKSEDRTIVDNLPNNMYKITYVIVGKPDKEELFCGVCHGVNGHTEECSDVKFKDTSEENPFSGPKLLLPQKGTIFPN